MAPYPILPSMHRKARRLGVRLRPSRRPTKKLDAIDAQGRVTSFGGRGYGDYHVYRRTRGESYARERRRLYKIRHASDRRVRKDAHGKYTAGFLADAILW